MYRLLIVDDEPIIVDGLLQLFSESELELEIHSAYSVAEALECALQVKLDIVITDMRMPEKSGLQFIDELQLLWPKCRIIFLSGYDQFEYVYDAVKRNIDNYILKTEDDEVLIAAVQTSIEKIELERSIQTKLEASEKQIEEIMPLLKRDFLDSLLNTNEIGHVTQNFSIVAHSLEIELDEQWFIVAGQITSDKSTNFQDLLLLNEPMKRDLHPNVIVEFFMYHRDLAIWFIQPAKIQGIFYKDNKIKWKTLKEYTKRFLESIQENYMLEKNIKANFVIGQRPVDVKLIKEDFQKICDYCKFISSFSENMIIIDQGKTNPFYHIGTEISVAQKWKKQLMVLESEMSEGEEKKAIKMIEGLFDQMVSNKYSNIDITDFLLSISQLILEFLRNQDLYQYIIEQSEDNLQKTLQQLPIIFDSKEVLLFLVKAICQYQAKSREEGKSKVILTVNKYIQDHIGGDLTLTAIADFIHFNPSYLSRFYKETTGRNLSDVINEVRVKKAKYYLSETKMAIHEIANQLGFNSPSYFTLYFKKNTLQSPQEYRDKNKEVKRV